MRRQPLRYPWILVVLHWLLALLIAAMLVAGLVVLQPALNSTPEKLTALRVHMALGGVILVLMLVRVVARSRLPRPSPATAGHAALDRLAAATHVALYLLVFAMLTSGIGIALVAGLPQIAFGGQGSLPASFADLPPRIAHSWLAWLLIAAVGLHLCGVLYHQLIRRDGVVRRMTLGSEPPT